jgi:uncharacterized protein with LGFP repeats
VVTVVDTAYQAAGGPTGALGLPVSDPGTTPDGKSRYQHFQGGSIYSTAATGTRVLPTAIRDAWAATGWEGGPLGYPTGDVTTSSDGRTRSMTFQGGLLELTDGTARYVPSVLLGAWQGTGGASGWLGLPTGDPGRTPDGKATYQHFDGGSIYSTTAYGTHAVPTAIRDAWAASGWENGPLGYPSGDATTTPDGIGQYQQFQGGAVYRTRATGAHTLRGPVYDAWARTGWEAGQLGYPTTDVTSTPDGGGAYAYFQYGAIYWSAPTGARLLRGAVLDEWAATGWEQGALGYPVSDQAGTPDGVGQYAHFQKGSIYATAATGAHYLPTVVRDAWAATGWERGRLGYPTGDPQPIAGGSRSTFQHGWIDVSSATGKATPTVN